MEGRGRIAALLLITFSAGYPRTAAPIKFVMQTKYEYDPRVINLLKSVTLLIGCRKMRRLSWDGGNGWGP